MPEFCSIIAAVNTSNSSEPKVVESEITMLETDNKLMIGAKAEQPRTKALARVGVSSDYAVAL